MPVPAVIVVSWEGRAAELRERLLSGIEEALGAFGAELRAEVARKSGEVFVALASFEPLDYDLVEEGAALAWGLGEAAPWTSVEVRGSELVAWVPGSPYYSAHLYAWRGRCAVVASPWWLPPAAAAAAHEGASGE